MEFYRIMYPFRYPFDGEARYIPVRISLLTYSIELASTAQRDQFAEKPHDIIKNSVWLFKQNLNRHQMLIYIQISNIFVSNLRH